VSVVIPAYRAAPFIAATLDSVLAQTFRDYEIIVVNDGSPDTAELEQALAPYRDRILYLRQENQGPAGARNTGIRAARGRYIAPLDADDLWEPEHLAAQVAQLEADPALDVVYADARIFGEVPEAGRTLMEFCPQPAGDISFEGLVTRRATVHICVLVARRETLLRAGLFDLAFRGTEDFEMWLRIVHGGGRIACQRRVLGRYRRRAGSVSSNAISMVEGALAVLAKAAQYPNLTAAQRQLIERQCVAERASLELQQAKAAFARGEAAAARSHLLRANQHYRSRRLALIALLLRVAPRGLQALYHWRDRYIYRLQS
jgi:glycosyltransferase involved in cell wall biosynthesis